MDPVRLLFVIQCQSISSSGPATEIGVLHNMYHLMAEESMHLKIHVIMSSSLRDSIIIVV